MALKELNFKNLLLWEGIMVLKVMVFKSFYFGRVWWS